MNSPTTAIALFGASDGHQHQFHGLQGGYGLDVHRKCCDLSWLNTAVREPTRGYESATKDGEVDFISYGNGNFTSRAMICGVQL